MTALVRAELLKLSSTRLTLWLLLANLALVAVTVALSVPQPDAPDALLSLDDPALLAVVVGVSLGVAEVLAVILGVLAATQEFRYGTATSTYLAEPRRARVLVAKCVSAVVAGLAVAVVTLAFSVGLSIALIRSRDGDATAGAQLWQVLAASLLVLAVYGVIGVAIGALVRNQVVAVVGVLVWMLFVEQLLVPAFPAVGRWAPMGATYSLLQIGSSIDLDDALLGAPVGGLLLVGYAVGATVLAMAVAPRRDVL